jgi:hypothetical protein
MAKKATKGSKNNIENRGASAKLKEIDGKQIKPVMYKGQSVGHGSYIAGAYVENGKLVVDANDKPVQFSKIVSQ